MFNGDYYIQGNGASMGHPCIPPVANIYLNAIETETFKIIAVYCSTLGTDPVLFMPKIYVRLMDDIFAVFPSEEAWKLFTDTFNTRRPTIKITHSFSSTSAVFLDIEYYRGSNNNTLETRLYRKPNNAYLYIPYSSMHNPSIHKSRIINERKRCKLICSSNDDYVAAELLFKSFLPPRGYPLAFVEKLFAVEIPSRSEMTALAFSRITERTANISINKSTPLITNPSPQLVNSI